MMRTKSPLFFFVLFPLAWTTCCWALLLFSVSAASAGSKLPVAAVTSIAAAATKTQGTSARRRRHGPIIQKLFDNADTNHDGSISRDEAYILVLKWYIKINQRAPIQPPSRQTVNQLFDLLMDSDKDKNCSISMDEFGNFCAVLWRRALVRVVIHKLVTFVGAPLLAEYIVTKSSQQTNVVATLQSLCQKLVPARFYPKVATKAFGRTALIILFCVTLGNFVMGRVNDVQAFWLHYQERRKIALQERRARVNRM